MDNEYSMTVPLSCCAVASRFRFQVPNAADWNLSGSTKDTVVKGERITWSPTESSSTLEVRCKPVANGLSKLISWIWPTRVVRLHGTTGVPAGSSRVYLVPQPNTQVWIASQVVANSSVTWDERVIPLLQFVAPGKSTVARGTPALGTDQLLRWFAAQR
jgi:hypothetical protein